MKRDECLKALAVDRENRRLRQEKALEEIKQGLQAQLFSRDHSDYKEPLKGDEIPFLGYPGGELITVEKC